LSIQLVYIGFSRVAYDTLIRGFVMRRKQMNESSKIEPEL